MPTYYVIRVHYHLYNSPFAVPCWAISIQCMPSQPNYLKSILTLSSPRRLCLPSGLFSPGFSRITLYPFLFCLIFANWSTHTHTHTSHSLVFGDWNHVWWGVLIIKLFVLQSSPVFSFLPSCSANVPSSTPPFSNTFSLRSSLNMSDQVSHPKQDNSQNYISVYFNRYIFV